MSEIRTPPPPRRAGAKAVLVEPAAGLPFDIVEAKIHAPAPAAGAVSRTALVNRLRADLTSRAVSIVAPAGYGKTTLLAQWAARDDRRFAWISLDRRDNDPVVLLRHVAAALDELAPLDARVLNALASPKPAPWDSIVPRLASAVAASERQVLVFDDTHVLSDDDSIEILSVLAEHVPNGSAIVVSTRVECPLAVRLRVGGGLLELGPDDLALTRREGELVLRAAGLELSDDACDDLYEKTEGWAGALQLAALAARRPGAAPGDSAEASAFAGDHRYVTAYIRAEYLSGLTEERLAFLRRTSLLERMSGPLCDAVLGRKHSARELEAIRSANLFLVPLDARGEWYRYHHLFRDLLRRELSENDADLVPELARRAGDWFEQHGDPESALDFALAAGDTDRAARILASIALPAACNGRSATAAGWLSRFDDAKLLERYPAVALQGARIHVMRGATLVAERWLAAAERSAVADPSLAPRLAVLRAAMCRDGVGTMLSDARSAVAGLAGDDQWLPLALLVYAAAHVMLGDNERADELLADAVAGAKRDGLGETEVVAASQRMLISEEAHEHASVDAQAAALSDLRATRGFETSAPCAIEFAASARSRLRRGNWEEARTLLDRALRLTPSLTDAVPWLSVQTRLELANAFVALRDHASAQVLLCEIDDILERRPDLGVLVERVEALRASLAALPSGEPGRNPGLTGAELRLLPFLTTHLSFREIGERLYLSRNTIKTQAISVYRKLGVSTRSDAMDRALSLGLVDETVQARTLGHAGPVVQSPG
jgi:LuxR family transcriptional regulator, maltose regulon positive regulatory protein